MSPFAIAPILILLLAPVAWSEPLQNPYFFEARRGSQTLLIFGTYHVGISIEEVPDYVIQALKRQNVFMAETLKDSPDSSADESTPTASSKPLSPDVVRQLEERGLSAKWIELLKKFPSLACTLYESYEGIRDHLLLDESLEELATKFGKIKLALDDPDQMKRLNRNKQSNCDLAKRVQEEPGAKAKVRYQQNLLEYRRGDLKDAEMEGDGDENEVAKRNALWIKKIVSQLPRKAFVTFGYGHLGGKSGILSLLKNHGFKIDRVNGKGKTPI